MSFNPKNIYKRPGRNMATLVAVAISMSLMVSMQSLADGLMHETLDDINKSKIDISITSKLENGIIGGHALMQEFEQDARVDVVSPMLYSSAPLSCRLTDKSGQMMNKSCFAGGIIPEKFKAVQSDDDLKLYEPRETVGFETMGDPHFAGGTYSGPWTYEVVIDKYHAGLYGIGVGDPVYLSAKANREHVRFNVTGLLDTETTGQGIAKLIMVVMLHLSELQTMSDVDLERTQDGGVIMLDKVDSVALGLDMETRTSPSRTKAMSEELEERFPLYEVQTKEDRIRSIGQQLTMIKGFTMAVSGVSLLIGLLFIATVMIMSIFERTNEIGMLRAIGISKGSIFRQFMAESMVIVAMGGLVGIFLGYFMSEYVADIIERTVGVSASFVIFSPLTIAQVFVVVMTMGLLASTGPAIKAMNMNIVDALKRKR